MVLQPMQMLVSEVKNLKVTVLHCTKDKDKNSFYKSNKKAFLTSGLKEIEVRRHAKGPRSYFQALYDFLNIFFIINRELHKYDILHVRGYFLLPVVFLLKHFRNFSFIFDPRGIFPEEAVFEKKLNNKSYTFRIYKYLEKWALKNAKSVIYISSKMRRHYQSIDDNINFSYIPNCSKTHTQPLHLHYSINNKPNFVYVGSVTDWHDFSRVADILLNFEKNSFEYNFSYLGSSITNAKKIIEGRKIKTPIAYKTVPFNELSQELSNYDFGFCLRANALISHLSFPVKFSDMSSVGISVIYDDYIGDLSKLDKSSLHIKIDSNDDEKTQNIKIMHNIKKRFKRINKSAITRQSNELLSWDSYKKTFLKMYKNCN